MRNTMSFRSRWLLSSLVGAGFVLTSAAALAQAVPGENATAPSGPPNGAATQTIILKGGQEAGTNTVLPADTAPNPNASVRDERFVMRASAGNRAEIRFGHLAEQRGQTQNERNFGRMLVHDHSHANMWLSHVADTLMLPMAKRPGRQAEALYQRLQAAPADQFDAMFNQAMVRGHEEAAQLYRMEIHDGQNADLRRYAADTLPVVEKHLRIAQSLTPTGTPETMANTATGEAQGMAGMPAGGMAPHGGLRAEAHAAMQAPISGNPDNSADQLNARVLSVTGQQS